MPDLSDDQLADIRRRHNTGYAALLRRIADAHGINPDCVEAIAHGRPWRHLLDRPPVPDLFERRR